MAAAMSSAACKRIASMAASTATRRAPGAARRIHSSTPKQMSSDGHGHGHGDGEYDYLHAEHMYNLPAMKNRTLKMGLAVFGVVAIGTAVPIVAVVFQQKKAMIM